MNCVWSNSCLCRGGDDKLNKPVQSFQKLCRAHLWAHNRSAVQLLALHACVTACMQVKVAVCNRSVDLYFFTSLCNSIMLSGFYNLSYMFAQLAWEHLKWHGISFLIRYLFGNSDLPLLALRISKLNFPVVFCFWTFPLIIIYSCE